MKKSLESIMMNGMVSALAAIPAGLLAYATIPALATGLIDDVSYVEALTNPIMIKTCLGMYGLTATSQFIKNYKEFN